MTIQYSKICNDQYMSGALTRCQPKISSHSQLVISYKQWSYHVTR